MPYRRDLAVQTVVAVAAALRAHWDILDAGTQAATRRMIGEFGPEIYDADALNRAGRMIALLDALSALPGLPGPVLDALRAGEGVSAAFIKITDAQRDQALDALRAVHDARRYTAPVELADALRLRIAQVYRSLDPVSRARWELLDRSFAEGGSPAEYLDAVDALLAERLPFVREAIDAGKSWSAVRYRSAARPKSPFDPGAGAQPIQPPTRPSDQPKGGVFESYEAPREVRRFANVYFPAQVHIAQQSVPLIVHIAQQQAAGTVKVSAGSAEMIVKVGELAIFVRAEGFDAQYGLGGAESPVVPYGATVAVREEGDSEAVVFFLTPKEPGARRISIEFFQSRRPVGSLAFDVDIVRNFAPGSAVGRAEVHPVRLSSAGGSRPPDLYLRVQALADGRSYEFILDSGDGVYQRRELGRVTLKSDPRGFFKTLMEELSSSAKVVADERTPQQDTGARERLRELGARLWDELVPPEFKAEYRSGKLDAYKGKTLMITSDEPWIPWEMVRPFERAGGQLLYNDPPLCELFRLSRWLVGNGAHGALTVKQGVVVAPRDNLASVQEEINYFKQVATRGGQWSVPVLTVAEVRDKLEAGSAELFHFSCHGNFKADDADESLLKLEGGFLAPNNIRFAERLGLAESAPLVFLNACHAGQAGYTMTRLGGWAQAFLAVGATAFIGSLWEINDKLAAMFAREFYDRLWGLNGQASQTVGEAFHGARMALKTVDAANPTWLAYVLYGDPNARIVFGS
jgi:hypothetical protein